MKRSKKLTIERNDLADKIIALKCFINSDDFEKVLHIERDRLKKQHNIMMDYHSILEKRITFSHEEEKPDEIEYGSSCIVDERE